MEQFKVICVNDKFKPDEIPSNLWVKKDEVYTVVDAKYLLKQHMSVGYKLAELNLPEDCIYQYFIANRFKPVDQDDLEAEAALQELLKDQFEEYA